MSTTTPVATTPVAPVQGQQGQVLRHGGHIVAYKAQPKFDSAATLELISGTNPWRPSTPGSDFWVKVLAKLPTPATVSDALALGAKAGLKPVAVQGHLRWLYTWGGSYIRVAGNVYSPPVASPVAPVAAPVKAPTKAKAKAKA